MILPTTLALKIGETEIEDPVSSQFDSLGDLISHLIPYIFVIAGLILLFVIIGAGFTMFTSVGNPESTKKAQQQLTFGLVGFVVIFLAYWIVQLLGSIFGISTL